MERRTTGHDGGLRSTYPIVDSWSLATAERSGFLGLRGRRRTDGELTRLREHASHHVLVYRVDGRLVEDRGDLEAKDLLDASHVSVVDMRRNAPVVVRFRIPSKDAKAFTVVVTFGCTVTDPVLVVRQGLIEPQQLLTNHVRSYHNAMRMGLDYAVNEFTEVRRAVDDELTAFHAVRPPVVEGLKIELASIEVETPEEVKEVWDKILQADHDQLVRTSELNHREKYEYDLARIDEKLRSQEEAYLHDRNVRRGDADRFAERLAALHAEELADLRGEAGRRRRAAELEARMQELARMREVSSALSDQVMYQAFLDGKLDPNEMTTLLRQDRESYELRAREDAERRLQQARDLEQLDREERLEIERARREDRRENERYLREIEARQAQLDIDERNHRWKEDEDIRREAHEAEQVSIETRLRFMGEDRTDQEARWRREMEASGQLAAASLERLKFHGELEGKRLDAELAREERQASWDHEARVEERHHRWKQENEERLFEQATREREFQAKLRLLEELSKHGHLDLVDLNIGAAINNILAEASKANTEPAPAGIATSEPVASLDAGEDAPAPDTGRVLVSGDSLDGDAAAPSPGAGPADGADPTDGTGNPRIVELPADREEAGRV